MRAMPSLRGRALPATCPAPTAILAGVLGGGSHLRHRRQAGEPLEPDPDNAGEGIRHHSAAAAARPESFLAGAGSLGRDGCGQASNIEA